MAKRLAIGTIVMVALLTLGALYQITTLRFDYEFEHFFPSNDPDLDFYYEFKDKFATDVDFVLLALGNDEGIFQQDFLEQSKNLRDELSRVPRVKRIISPFDAKSYALGPFGPIAIPYLHPSEPERYARDSAKIYEYQKEVGTLFSEDALSMSMVIEIEPNLSKLETDTVYLDLKAVIDQYEYDELHLAGKVIGQAYYIEQIKREFTLFFALAVILVVVILSLVYRSVWGVIVTLLIVLLSVIWMLGLMGLIDKPIDIMTALLPLVLFVVGVSDVIHLLSRYFEEIRNGHPKLKAIEIAYRQVGLATFLTSFTTALGFLTLLTSTVKPIRELGMFAAAGVFVAFLLAFSLLPAILTLTKVPKLAYKEPSNLFWNKIVRKFFFVAMRRQRAVLLVSSAVIAISVWGAFQVEINNYLLEDVGKDDPMRHSFEFFEDHFAGARPFEMYISVKDSNESIYSVGAIREMEAMEGYLKSDYGVGFMVSPLSIVRTMHQAMNGGLDSAYRVPEDSVMLKRVLKQVRRFERQPEFSALVGNEAREARISGKMVDQGGKRTKELSDSLAIYAAQQQFEHINYRLTGMALLIDKNNETLSVNMMSGLIIALLVVAVIMGFLFRSFTVALVTLVPNVLPLLVIGGVMGLFGIDLRVTTSIIFGIAFGIAVDDSIHYMSKYRLELGKGRSVIWALRRTSISTGKAIVLTSLILCAGFFTLSSSSFTSTHEVGVLISITLAIAVMADLFLLPILLKYIGVRRKK